MDGLFVVLAARWAKIHVAMVHKDGVWSTRTSGGSQEGDLMLCLTDKGICVAEPIPIVDLSVVGGEWTESPPVIHLAVRDIAEVTQCMGFKPHQQEPESLLSVLSAFLRLGQDEYCIKLIHWFLNILMDSPIALEWWNIQGQDWSYYRTLLEVKCKPDGLEVWAACVMSRQHLNLIQHGQIWTSCQRGVCNTNLTLMIVPDGVILCDFVMEPPSAPPKRVHP